MGRAVMSKRVMVNDAVYVNDGMTLIDGGKDMYIGEPVKSQGGGLTLAVVIIICMVLGVISGIFVAKRSALK